MAVLNMLYNTGRAGSFIVLGINEEACANEWIEGVPLFAFLVTMAEAWKNSNSISEKVMWENQLNKGIKVFLSGDAPTSKKDSLEFEWYEVESEDASYPLDLDFLTLESVQNFGA